MSSVYFSNDADRFSEGRYMKKILPIALALLCFISTAQAAGQRKHRSTHRRNQSATATATCRDGTTSYSAHRRGTCSHHGGVKTWSNNGEPNDLVGQVVRWDATPRAS